MAIKVLYSLPTASSPSDFSSCNSFLNTFSDLDPAWTLCRQRERRRTWLKVSIRLFYQPNLNIYQYTYSSTPDRASLYSSQHIPGVWDRGYSLCSTSHSSCICSCLSTVASSSTPLHLPLHSGTVTELVGEIGVHRSWRSIHCPSDTKSQAMRKHKRKPLALHFPHHFGGTPSCVNRLRNFLAVLQAFSWSRSQGIQ